MDLARYAREIDDGRLGLTFEGYVCNHHPTNPDTSQVVLEYLDAAKAQELAKFDSGVIKNGTSWRQVRDARAVPKGTRWVRVRLLSVRHNGHHNDGYYDSLWLKADVVPPPADPAPARPPEAKPGAGEAEAKPPGVPPPAPVPTRFAILAGQRANGVSRATC